MKWSAWARLILICGLLSWPESPGVAPVQAKSPQVTGLRVTEEADGLLLEWNTPPLAVSDTASGQTRLEISGYDSLAVPGQPQLPQTSALLALPPGADPVLTLLDEQSTPLELPGPVETAPQPGGVRRTAAGEVIGGTFESLPTDGSAVQTPAVAVVALELVGIQRGVRLARLVFNPIQPLGSTWRYVQSVRAQIRYPMPVDRVEPRSAPGQPDPILEQIRAQVINPGQVTAGGRLAGLTTAAFPAVASSDVAIEVKDSGLTQITYDALKTAGFPVDSVDPQMLQLWQAGGEVALEWDGNGDAVFSSAERLIFFANPRFSRWMNSDVYWLKIGSQAGKRIAGREGSPDAQPLGILWREILVENNNLYTPDCYCGDLPLARNGDRWVWDSLSQPGRPSRLYSFTMESVDSVQPGSLMVWMIGNTSLAAPIDHRVDFTLNSVSLGFLEWDGKQAAETTLNIPAGLLKTGQNSLALSVPVINGVAVDGVWLDAFQVRYALGSASPATSVSLNGSSAPHAYTISFDPPQGLRIYDLQAPDSPVRLTHIEIQGSQVRFGDDGVGGIRYALATEAGLLQPVQVRMRRILQTTAVPGADYLVITHPDFAAALDPLLQLRQAQGLVTAVEDVEAIYDRYAEGRREPGAIQAFLADIYQRWLPRPLYVLLVGDGTNDPKRYQTNSSITWIPPVLSVVDPWIGETAADNRFVTVDGDDSLPDMAIGRLPVNNLDEIQAVVAKLVRYETRPDFGPWTRRLALIADNADESGNFAQLSDELAELLETPYQPVRAYYQSPQNTSSDIQLAVLGRFDSGSGMMIYTGHASIHQWAAESFLHISQLPVLSNLGKLPLLLEMNCLTASFQVAGFPTLDEALLRAPEGGVVAAWGSTGLGIATGHNTLAKSIVQGMYGNGQERIGLAILQAKTALAAAQPAYLDLLDTYTLLGDPASLINVYGNVKNSNYLPVILR